MCGQKLTPSITVLGLYSPAANVAEFERFVRQRVSWLEEDHFTPEDRTEAEKEIREILSGAAVIEAMIVNADERFNAGDFVQPDPSLQCGEWQAAWNETYLSADGETVLAGYPSPEVPQTDEFRVVFVIHFWKPGFPLMSSYGEISLPSPQSQPERLWRLIQYEIPG